LAGGFALADNTGGGIANTGGGVEDDFGELMDIRLLVNPPIHRRFMYKEHTSTHTQGKDRRVAS